MSIELKKNFQIIQTSSGASCAILESDIYALALLKQGGGEKIAEVAVIAKTNERIFALAAEQAYAKGLDECTIDMSGKLSK